MAKWKLRRQLFGSEEFVFFEGEEVSVGRGMNNTITLSSIVVSRNHCVINVQRDHVLITDLKSSNGIYVGLKKIPQNVPYELQDSDIIGFGWTKGAPVANINDHEKFMFKLVKEKHVPIADRLTFQSDNEVDEVEAKIAAMDNNKPLCQAEAPSASQQFTHSSNKQLLRSPSPLLPTKVPSKRKLEESPVKVKIEPPEPKSVRSRIFTIDDDVILLSDSENEKNSNNKTSVKKTKLEPICEQGQKQTIKEEIVKTEKEDLEYAFNVKQEYLGYDDEAIQIDSESDSESEQWLLRLSQSSPGKPFTKLGRESKIDPNLEESSYSQIDDFIVNNDKMAEDDNVDEAYEYDLISISPLPPENNNEVVNKEITASEINNQCPHISEKDDVDEDFVNNLISFDNLMQSNEAEEQQPKTVQEAESPMKDVVDGICKNYENRKLDSSADTALNASNEKNKKIQVIELPIQFPRKKSSTNFSLNNKTKSSSKHSKSKKHSSSKRHISSSQKEERKKKLKEIATKEKEDHEQRLNKDSSSSTKQEKAVINVKVTSSNRGAFLTDVVQGVVKPMKRKESPQRSKNKDSSESLSPLKTVEHKLPAKIVEYKLPEPIDDIENKKKLCEKSKTDKHKSTKRKDYKAKSTQNKHEIPSSLPETRVPLKSLKPLSESEESFSGKPFSKVEPLPPKKQKKKVRFSDEPPQVHVFEIPLGNKMKKTSLARTSLVDAVQTPVFSLEKITLMKILRWNPQWLDEQLNNNEPPPILGHNNLPMTIFHSFNSHSQYIQLVGDLLLMEIWECLTQGYMKARNQNNGLEMRIASLPPVPTQDRSFELFNLSVNISVPNSEIRNVPRMGEVMIVAFGPETARNRRFFFVHNIRSLPSPPNNIHSFFCISLHACYTEKMKSLKLGELMIGVSLAYIHKELMLFEAMEYLAGSPLNEAILRPEPRHFMSNQSNPANYVVSQWTKTLNPSQHIAVRSSVSAALGDRPCIQMVQGPPGTGKSSVICAIVMSYFYDTHGKKQQNRGKILICATSNAAVDDLVIRLLKIRQDLPKTERFRMVRVGRAEAMHPRAFDVSSQQLAQRDAARAQLEPAHPGLCEEISHLEAKKNMWLTQAQDAKDPVRVAYCQTRVSQIVNRIALLRSGGGGGGGAQLRADQLAQAERRIIEGADIVITTLGSAHNHKMRGLKRRIALCIVDEAGQAIEPETLIPLTLDVTRLTLIGDPQQLPGFICSQRAKKHGLGESLFSRLASCTEHRQEGSPVVFLNQQYRMHADIADYPNRAFYGGCIQTMTSSRPNLAFPPYSIVSISSGDKGQGISGANEMEAWGVARLVVALSTVVRAANLSLAVITPYNAHKELIKKNLRLLQDPADANIEVNTVDSFQGQERDVVVVSLARSQGVGFLTDAGRMNVMLTRARHALLVCLNPHAMLKNYQWRTLVEDAQKRNLYRVLPNKMCQSFSGSVQPEDILKYIMPHKPGYK